MTPDNKRPVLQKWNLTPEGMDLEIKFSPGEELLNYSLKIHSEDFRLQPVHDLSPPKAEIPGSDNAIDNNKEKELAVEEPAAANKPKTEPATQDNTVKEKLAEEELEHTAQGITAKTTSDSLLIELGNIAWVNKLFVSSAANSQSKEDTEELRPEDGKEDGDIQNTTQENIALHPWLFLNKESYTKLDNKVEGPDDSKDEDAGDDASKDSEGQKSSPPVEWIKVDVRLNRSWAPLQPKYLFKPGQNMEFDPALCDAIMLSSVEIADGITTQSEISQRIEQLSWAPTPYNLRLFAGDKLIFSQIECRPNSTLLLEDLQSSINDYHSEFPNRKNIELSFKADNVSQVGSLIQRSSSSRARFSHAATSGRQERRSSGRTSSVLGTAVNQTVTGPDSSVVEALSDGTAQKLSWDCPLTIQIAGTEFPVQQLALDYSFALEPLSLLSTVDEVKSANKRLLLKAGEHYRLDFDLTAEIQLRALKFLLVSANEQDGELTVTAFDPRQPQERWQTKLSVRNGENDQAIWHEVPLREHFPVLQKLSITFEVDQGEVQLMQRILSSEEQSNPVSGKPLATQLLVNESPNRHFNGLQPLVRFIGDCAEISPDFEVILTDWQDRQLSERFQGELPTRLSMKDFSSGAENFDWTSPVEMSIRCPNASGNLNLKRLDFINMEEN